MIRASIIGCGKIADAHAASLGLIKNCVLVGVCDRERLMAEQLRDRFGVETACDDVEEMIHKSRPDVVHITTPPQSHFPLARLCLEKDCHVYVEKPFTLNTDEATELISLAEKRNRKLTAGHDDQFSHVARRLRAEVRNGFLGGPPVHIESYYGYEIGGEYVKALLGDANHWVRKLPGRLLHNIISHGIARIAEYINSEKPAVMAYGFTSKFLRELGEKSIIDELRVVISDEPDTTAYFTFSSQMRPSLHRLKLYGQKNGLLLDEDEQILLKLRGKRLISYTSKFIPPLDYCAQHLSNLSYNAGRYIRNDFHMKSGMRYLIEAFYASITKDDPLPIPYREIILVSRIMDSIFLQLGNQDPGRMNAESIAGMPIGTQR